MVIMSQYMLTFKGPSVSCCSPQPAAPNAVNHDTPTIVLDCERDTSCDCALLTWLSAHKHTLNHRNQISSEDQRTWFQ